MIRAFRASDIPAIKSFFTDTQVFDDFEIACLDEDLTMFAEGHYPDDRILVSGSDKPEGIIHYGPLPITDRSWCLHWIGVDPNVQSKGIGASLVAGMEADIRSQLGRIIMIETSSRDVYANTRMFYQKLGYQLATKIPDYYSEGDHKCIYMKKL